MSDDAHPVPPASPPDVHLLTPFRLAVAEQRLGVRSIRVHRPGHEDVAHEFTAPTEENVWSISKTVTALGVGIAREEGLLDLEDLLVDHLDGVADVPAAELGAGVDTIRLRHLLTMTAGHPNLLFTPEEKEQPDPAVHFLRTDLVEEPGSRFVYSNACTHLLARVTAARFEAAGAAPTGSTLRDHLMERLFLPLGILNPQWHTVRSGQTLGASGLHLLPEQLSRLGRLLLQRGEWDGARLVPADWIDALHAESAWVPTGDGDAESTRYGYGVWACTPEGGWRADGAFGQFLVVLPEQDAVLTVTSKREGGAAQDILRAIWRELLPQL